MSLASLLGLSPDEPTKAQLYCLEMSDWTIEFPFNPTKFKVKREVDWSEDCAIETPWPTLNYDGAKSDRLSFSILLDETEVRNSMVESLMELSPIMKLPFGLGPSNDNTVLPHMLALYRLTLPVKTEGGTDKDQRPPLVAFLWGTFQFIGVVEEVDAEVILFDEDGNPKRAEVDIDMKGRAMQMVSSADDFFEPSYTAPTADAYDEPTVGFFDDPRLDMIDNLKKPLKRIG